MNKREMIKRYLIFCVGLVLNSFGVAFVTKAALGTSPIASIPYSLSMVISGLSLGTWVIIFNVFLVLLQVLIQRGLGDKVQILLEVIIAFFFGSGVDLSMLCLEFFAPQSYAVQLLSLVVGCAIIALGAYLEVVADVVMLPGDAFVRAIARAVKRKYGMVRVISDTSMSVVAGVICLAFLGELTGVREGTIISALLVGNMVKLFTRFLAGAAAKLLPGVKA